jgi:hypothetical protein
MKILLIASALLASSTALAGTYTTSENFGTQGSSFDKALTNQSATFGVDGLDEVVTIEAFDISLGTLTGVEVNVFSQINSSGTSTNNSILAGQTSFEFSLENDWTITSSVGSLILRDSGILFTAEDLNHGVGLGFVYDELIDFQERSIAVADTEFYIFLNDVDFLFSVDVRSTFTNTTFGIASFENITNSASWGKIEVTYTYENVVASVPETGSLAIFGLGLAGLALSRKSKKSI